MTCPECGHYNGCPQCNSWLCEICGAELPPDNHYVQKLNKGDNDASYSKRNNDPRFGSVARRG